MNSIFLIKISKLREWRIWRISAIYFHNSFIFNNKNYNYKNLSCIENVKIIYVKIILIKITNQCKEEKNNIYIYINNSILIF